MNTIWIVLPILTVLMFDLGLTLRWQDFSLVLKHPKPFAVALFGQIILLPLIAWGLGWLFFNGGTNENAGVFFLGLLLIACCPGGSSSNVFSRLANGNVALSVLLTAASSLLTLITLPLIMSWATTRLGAEAGISLPVGNLLKQNLLLMLLPVLVGVSLRHFQEKLALRIDKILSKAAFPALMLLITIFFIQHHETIGTHIGSLGMGVTALIVLSILGAGLLARLFRVGGRERRTIIIEVGMQNAAQAIALASSPFVFNNERMAIPAILYSLMMNIVLLIYVGAVRMWTRK